VSGNEKVGLLQQRRIEANIFKAVLNALEKEMGADRARSLVASIVRGLAFEKGRELRKQHPEGDICALAGLWQSLGEGGALDVELIEQTDDCLCLRVKRCGYAEAYQEMGLADLGYMLSCERDERLLRGFSDEITLERSFPTIMEGGDHCDVIYTVKK
jgi:hypothetical protein